MVVLQRVRVDHVLIQVARPLFTQHELVQVTEAEDERRHAGVERQALPRSQRLIPHPLEQRQVMIGPFFRKDMPQDVLHRCPFPDRCAR
jgi:hypothetical protein